MKSKNFVRSWMALALLAGTLGAGGCTLEKSTSSSKESGTATQGGTNFSTGIPAAKPAAETKPAAAESKPAAKTEAPPARAQSGSGASYRPALPAGYTSTQMAFPTGDVNSSALMIHQVIPQQVRVGQNYNYEIHVTNLTNSNLSNVVVSNESLSNLSVISSTPAATGSGGNMMWALGDLASGRTTVIKLVGKADKVGISSNCISASYNNSLCAAVQVVEPALAVTKTITPAEATVCEPVTMSVTVKNTGTGNTENVRVKDALPAGLTTEDGKTALDLPMGTLASGESKTQTIKLKAGKAGKYDNFAEAVADGGLTAKSQTVSVVFRQPSLSIECKSADRVFIGRDATFEVTIKNTGDAAVNNATVTGAVPAGSAFQRATDGGAVSGGNVSWKLGSIAAGATKTISATFKANEATTLRFNATAGGDCATAVNTACSTNVVGIPALLLDGSDDPDPIQIGDSVTYTLTVTNQGTAPLTNVKLVCSMEEGTMTYVSSTGATAGTVAGQVITFAPIAKLDPKAKATYKIVIKAAKEGQVQFKGEASSNEITRPLLKVETTNFYK